MITHLDICVSTNKMLLDDLRTGITYPDGYTIYTSFQSSGYGQIGNHWESESGKNLLFSMVIHPSEVHASEQFFISEAIALAIYEYLRNETTDITIKWPNDIYWKDKKIAGILIENNLAGAFIKDCVIGVGLNLNQEVFTSDAPNPISLTNITGNAYNIADVLNKIRNNFLRLYSLGVTDREKLHSMYMKHLFRFGVNASYSDCNGDFFGKITAVSPDGHIHITDTDNKERIYAFKEVNFKATP
ncbi:MAG: biotin--[acetyl-CoA-carboxylase] ligase [Paludibacteraceae bacterium]|nr:biotin--[acetyl-CoA-carboxylase] ligase [Paludibacteraceae bacterium]